MKRDSIEVSPQLANETDLLNNTDETVQTIISEWQSLKAAVQALLLETEPPAATDERSAAGDADDDPSNIALLREYVQRTLRAPRSQILDSTLLRRYRWAIVPMIFIMVLLLNGRIYYDTFKGYDMPQHSNNVSAIMLTGTMPLERTASTYEAQQAPLFYILAAWVTFIGRPFFEDVFQNFTTGVILLPFAFAWIVLLAVIVQTIMRRVHPLLRALTLCVVALSPLNILTMGMFSNDLPVTLFSGLAVFLMWLMCRSGRQLDIRMWLRTAAIIGLAVAFKNNAIVIMIVYAGLAVWIAGDYALRRRFPAARQVVLYAGVGVPLMLIPFLVNTWHTMRYAGDPLGPFGTAYSLSEFNNWQYFLRVDDTFFSFPLGFGPGERSFWSMQYVTLHADYYYHWRSDDYWNWDQTAMMTNVRNGIIPFERFNETVLLQYIALPITAVIIFGFVMSALWVIFRRHQAIRDGSVVIMILAGVAQFTQAALYIRYPSVHPPMTHARYMVYFYPILFIIGVMWLWKLFSGQRKWQVTLRPALVLCLSAMMIAYALVAFKLMWLPTVPFE